MLIPSIDLMSGKAVQLVQGKKKVLEEKNVFKLAKYFSRFGDIAVIDLDAVLGKGENEEIIQKLCEKYDCRVGGGIRTVEKAKKILGFGAKKIIIGTKAEKKFLKQLPKCKLIVAVDAKEGKIVTEGWTKESKVRVEKKIKELKNYCSGFLFTDVGKEGLMKGGNIEKALELRKKIPNSIDFTYAGGLDNVKEIALLNKNNINTQLGMAVYTGKLNLEEAFVSCLDFSKGLIPTIVKDEKQVLMLAYSNEKSVLKTLKTGKGVYFSRSKNRLWKKGETSGNEQEIEKASFDCDQDALLFKVRQKNGACHYERFSCFGEKEFGLKELYQIIETRKNSNIKNSYTKKLLKDNDLLDRKLNEEMFEVIQAKNTREKVFELADLMYFTNVFMVKNGIQWKNVLNELSLRCKNENN